MNFWDNVMQKWNLLREKSTPAMQVAGKVAKSTGNVLSTIWRYIKAFKKVWLTIPVVVGAILLAIHNLTHLPEVVGLNLQTDGVFALQIPRGTAVFADRRAFRCILTVAEVASALVGRLLLLGQMRKHTLECLALRRCLDVRERGVVKSFR